MEGLARTDLKEGARIWTNEGNLAVIVKAPFMHGDKPCVGVTLEDEAGAYLGGHPYFVVEGLAEAVNEPQRWRPSTRELGPEWQSRFKTFLHEPTDSVLSLVGSNWILKSPEQGDSVPIISLTHLKYALPVYRIYRRGDEVRLRKGARAYGILKHVETAIVDRWNYKEILIGDYWYKVGKVELVKAAAEES